MAMRMEWMTSGTSSGLYAAHVLQRDGRLVDTRLQTALTPACGLLQRVVGELSAAPDPVLRELAAAGFPDDPSAEQLAELLRTTLGVNSLGGNSPGTNGPADSPAARLAEAVAQVNQAQRSVLPNLEQDLRLRAGPLQNLWEERGPGMMRTLARLLDVPWIPTQARLVLVQPVAGGGGEVSPRQGTVVLEGMLANPFARLPETVRLAWLLARLGAGQEALTQNAAAGTETSAATTSDGPSTITPSTVAALALVPVTLAAAEHLELVHFDQELLQTALAAWHAASGGVREGGEAGSSAGDGGTGDGDQPAELARRLGEWWSEYQQHPGPWHQAVGQLRSRLADLFRH